MPDPTAVAEVIREWMGRFTMRSMHGWAKYVRDLGLTMAQVGVLMRLHHHGGCGISDIAEDFGITSAAASQLVDRLVHGDLVERSENPQDRRARILDLSDRGREVIDHGFRERYRWVDDLVAELAPAVQTAMLATLPVVMEAESRLPGGHTDHPSHSHSIHRSSSC